jgi:TIR domain/SIR2-like domain
MNQPTSILERKFRGLFAKIDTGDCVLVLGPRVAVPAEIDGDESIPIDDYLSGKLLEDVARDIPEPSGLRGAIARYEKEKGASACRSLIQELVSDLGDRSTDLHRDLGSLPFRLILSTTPDRMMFHALRAQGKLEAQEACYDYCRGVAAEGPLTQPSSDRPIVYNLFGRHDYPESMVLNDKNLLDYLVKITRESPALPDPVRAVLRAPSTVFLFVGFGFTSWWLRLLLKVLDVTGVENRGISLALEDNSSLDGDAAGENKGFFESLGIYIQAQNWSSLAKELAARFRTQEGQRRTAKRQTMASDNVQGRPLVFVSYASEDVDQVDSLRVGLQSRGVSMWQDRQNLRCGQNWENQVTQLIKNVDYFLFVQTENMDQRDQRRQDGVYNRELELALARAKDKPYGAVFVLRVTIGACRARPEPEFAKIHRIAVDGDAGVDDLARAILEDYTGAGQGTGSGRPLQVG